MAGAGAAGAGGETVAGSERGLPQSAPRQMGVEDCHRSPLRLQTIGSIIYPPTIMCLTI